MLESITSSVKEKSIDYKEKLTYLDSAKAESPRWAESWITGDEKWKQDPSEAPWTNKLMG